MIDVDLQINPKKLTPRQLEIISLRDTGLTYKQIGDKLGIKESSVIVMISEGRKRVLTNDPVIRARLRAERRLKKADTMIGVALDRGIESERFTDTGARVAVELMKGLGVLTTKVETSSKVETIETKRQEAILRLEAAKQFGVSIPAEFEVIESITNRNTLDPDKDISNNRAINAEIIEPMQAQGETIISRAGIEQGQNKPQTGTKQRAPRQDKGKPRKRRMTKAGHRTPRPKPKDTPDTQS